MSTVETWAAPSYGDVQKCLIMILNVNLHRNVLPLDIKNIQIEYYYVNKQNKNPDIFIPHV